MAACWAFSCWVFFRKHVGEVAAMAGMAAGVAGNLVIRFATPIAFTWYVPIGTALTLLVALAAAAIHGDFRQPREPQESA